MSCGRVSLLTNVTREPGGTVTSCGDTPLAVIVIVAATVRRFRRRRRRRRRTGRPGSSSPPHADDDRAPAGRSNDAADESLSGHQKNFLEMLKPRYQSSLPVPPRASWPIVVPKPFEKLSWNTWPPARFSMPKVPWLTPGS